MVAVRVKVGTLKLSGKKLEQAGRRAGARAAAKGRTAINKEIAKESGLKASAVRKAVKRKKTKIQAEGGPINIKQFRRFRELKRGARVTIRGKTQTLRKAFLIGDQAYQRTDESQNPNRPGKLTKHSQSPAKLWGPGVATSFDVATRKRHIQKLIKETLIKEFRRQVELLSAK